MIVAGLTGGIACGKTTVAMFFRQAGADVICADDIAHQVVAPGLPAWQAVVDVFGSAILTSDRRIDRAALAELVFADARKRRRLEAMIHPFVRRRIDADLATLQSRRPEAVVILDIPLLFEAGMHDGLKEIIVVHVPGPIQIARLMDRDGLSRSAAQARIDAQMPMDEKKRRATVLIDNSGSLDDTRRQVLAVFEKLAGPTGAH